METKSGGVATIHEKPSLRNWFSVCEKLDILMRLGRVRVVIGFPICSSAANGEAYFFTLDHKSIYDNIYYFICVVFGTDAMHCGI